MIRIQIDDREISVTEGTTILESARRAGIWIPTLCYHPGLSSNGSCRLCMVEVTEGKRTKLVTACNYPVRRDSTVLVNSPRATAARKGVMELLLARSPDSMELKEIAGRMGIETTPYPTVTESQRNCILCGLCVKVCEEIMGCSAIGFTGRGLERKISPPFQLATDACIACGACAAVCPVGTIQVRIHADTGEAEISPFKSRVKLIVCEECGKKTVSEPVAAETINKLSFNWEEFRQRARLCPECRRKNSARSLAYVSSLKGGQLNPDGKDRSV